LTALEVIISSAITLTGLYLAYGFHRQQRLKIAEQRIDAYRKLWNVMGPARPSRLDPPESAGPVSASDAGELYKSMTAWYFENGNGMMLTETTRAMYLEAKRLLGAYSACAPDDPASEAEGKRRMRELSLLRTQMKFDLAIYGLFYPGSLDEQDEQFIRACGIDPATWARPLSHRLRIGRYRHAPRTQGPRWPGGGGATARD
jgi:hypothetical protein